MSFYELEAEERGYYHFERRPLWDMNAHFHSAPEFVFVEKGEAEVCVDGETRVLQAGEGCFSDSFCRHSYRNGGKATVYVFLGDRGFFERFFRDREGMTFPRFFTFADFSLLKTLLKLYKNTADRRNAGSVFGGAAELLCGRLAESVPLVARDGKEGFEFACAVLRYAETHAGEDLSLEALSEKFGYSRGYLSRILHSYVREHWNLYVNRLRVTAAARLLKEEPERSVLEIAYECGFDSPNTFYRAYAREFGAPPRRSPAKKSIVF